MIWFWIIFFIMSCIGAKVSLMSNHYGGKWFVLICIMSAIPYFPLISLWSKNILVDSVVYDAVILFAYLLVYLMCGEGKFLTVIQWVGLSFTVIGLILMKMRINL